jgi:hypothetical protein
MANGSMSLGKNYQLLSVVSICGIGMARIKTNLVVAILPSLSVKVHPKLSQKSIPSILACWWMFIGLAYQGKDRILCLDSL